MGFANVIHDHELKNDVVKDEKFPPGALMAFSYAATNSAGYRAEVSCGRPLQSAPDGPPLATTAMAMPRMLPCTIALSSPVRASSTAKKEAERKAKEEKARRP